MLSVDTVLTLLAVCISSYTLSQTRKHHKDMQRAYVTLTLNFRRGENYLEICNTGRSVATDIRLLFDKDFLSNLFSSELYDSNDFLKEMSNHSYTLVPNGRIVLKVSFPPFAHMHLRDDEQVYIGAVQIAYKSLGKKWSENYSVAYPYFISSTSTGMEDVLLSIRDSVRQLDRTLRKNKGKE